MVGIYSHRPSHRLQNERIVASEDDVPVIKTYTLKHGLHLDGFLLAYRDALNKMISKIWENIRWIEKSKKSSNQVRVFPSIPSYAFKKRMRGEFLNEWEYSAHWIDSALKTAFSIIDSWKKNYNKGQRKRNKPVVKRFFVRVKQTLMKVENERMRISIKPNQFVYVDLSKRYFPLDGKIGEPILTDTRLHIPITLPDGKPDPNDVIGWDSNIFSIDGYSESRGWVKVDIKSLHTIHVTYDDKFRSINRVYARNKKAGKKLYAKYRARCRNRVKEYLCDVANLMTKVPAIHGFENLEKKYLFKSYRHRWNRNLGHRIGGSSTSSSRIKPRPSR